ncbi:leucine-rich repeat and guanylate kinase domain-containing protein [Ctenodactylus gundi]
MAASGKEPQRSRAPSPLRGMGSSPRASRARFTSEKGRHSPWSSVSKGHRPKGTSSGASSHLLQELSRSSQNSDEERCQGEGESEESSESEMANLEKEFDGVLTEEAVAKALHELGRSGPGTEQVYLKLTLSGCDLIDISILCEYIHLQKLDLSVNKIEDLSCVSYMPYLLELNVSQNKLSAFFNFKPPKNLKKVDFSSNQISEMCDLSAYHALNKLILDNNEIQEISGLEMCNSLTHLSLANNKITTINGLNTLPIKILCLSNNQIEKITGLENLRSLQNLDLSHNRISSLQGLENLDLLEVINLEDNEIAELREVEYIENLPILRILNLLRNPIQEESEYWLFVIFMLLRLTELDQKKIEVEEKVAAVNKYDPPPEVIAAQDHLTHIVNSVMQPQKIFDSTLPSLDTPYPMLILAGPQACGKRELAHRLCRQFSTYFRYGACHTTRPPYFGEGDRVDYHFISQEVFDEMLSMGKFILTFAYGNYKYGLNRDTVEGIARDGLASCIHMEIEGVRSLKCSYFEPRYILVVPMNKEKYEGHLRRKGLFSRAEIEFAVSRVDLYVKINQKFPGYFDAVINADDMDAAYQKLSQLIQEYLGLTKEPTKGLAPTTGASSSKKTISGVPAHLVPSPRRLAKLQADSQITEHLSGGQAQAEVPESQNPASSQSQEPTQEGETQQKELPPSTLLTSEPPQQPSLSALGVPPQAQDVSPNPMEEGVKQSDLSSEIATTKTDVSESEAQPPEVEAAAGEQPTPTASHMPPQPPDAPAQSEPQPDQVEESGEASVAPNIPPIPEPPQEPGPASLSPQKIQDKETESFKAPPSSSHRDSSEDPSHLDSVKELEGNSQPPLKEGTPKAGVARVSTPYPELPAVQDSPRNTTQSQDGEHPVALPTRSRLAPTRLPQPQKLAPLQSRRLSPKLLSPNREEATGTTSDQTMTPYPRTLPSQEADPSKLPAISPLQSKLPHSLSPYADQAPQQVQEEKDSEVKLPVISPPAQEKAPQPIPSSSQEEEAPKVRLPRIQTPFTELQLSRTMGSHSNSKPAKEKKAPKVGHPSSKKIPAVQDSPHTQEPVPQNRARKKKLPLQREAARGLTHPQKAPPEGPRIALPLESHNKAAPNPNPLAHSQGNQRPGAHITEVSELPYTKPPPSDPQSQGTKRGKMHHLKKKAQANFPPYDQVPDVNASKNAPSLKKESSERLLQENEASLSDDQPIQDGQHPQKSLQSGKFSAESVKDSSGPVEHSGKRDQVHKKKRSQMREIVSEPPQQESVTPVSQQPVRETQAHQSSSQIRESSIQMDSAPASKQQTKEKRPRKNGDGPQDKSLAASQDQVSAKDQNSRTGRLRARGSQSTKV